MENRTRISILAPYLLLLAIGACAQPQPTVAASGPGFAPGRDPNHVAFASDPDRASFEGIEARTPEGRNRLLALAGRGNPAAMLGLGVIYADGNSVPQDCGLAQYWLDQATDAIPSWGANDADKGELAYIVATLQSDPEMGLPKWCSASAAAPLIVGDCTLPDGAVIIMDVKKCAAIGGTVTE